MRSKSLKYILGAVTILLVGVGIAYAALSTTLNISVNSVTQNALTWNVGFTGTSATATEGGTSSVGRTCGAATITTNSVILADTVLSKPDDSCTYTLTIKNNGTIPAKFNTITPTAPSGITCTTATGGTIECGNIIYKLTSDSTGNTVITTGSTLAANATQTVYLVVKNTGTVVSGDAETQSGAKFTLNFIQS